MITKCPLRTITQAPYPRALTALVAATLAVLIDPIFRFSDYRALVPLLPAVGTMKFSAALTLVFLQVIVDVPKFLVVGERHGRKGALSQHSPWHPGFASEEFHEPPRSDGRTDVFAGSSLRPIDFSL